MSTLRPILLGLTLMSDAAATRAEPAPPSTAPGIRIVTLGTYCRFSGVRERRADPWLADGYVSIVPGDAVFNFRQQTIPARLGLRFGLLVMSDRDIFNVIYVLWPPGDRRPDVWEGELYANESRFRGESFSDPDDLVPGLWRMEAFDGMTRLYRVEWEVRPPTYAPEITSFCEGPS